MNHPSAPWHIVPLKFSRWNILYALDKKSPSKYNFFQTFEYSNESSPKSSCHFWNHRFRVYSNFASLFSVIKDNSSVFFLAETLYTLDKKSSTKRNFQTFQWFGEIHQIPHVLIPLKPQVSFSLNFAPHFSVTRDNSCVSFSWNFIWFEQKEPIKVQNIRLLTAHAKFHQIFTLIGSFCWKFVKFQLKRYRKVMFHDTEEWCKILRKTDLLFQRWQEFGKCWPEHSTFLNFPSWLVPFEQSI